MYYRDNVVNNNTVKRRINEMAQDVEDLMCGNLNSSQFSTQICQEMKHYV